MCRSKLGLLLIWVALTACEAVPQKAPLGLGQEPVKEQIAAWDIDVRPDGAGLPEGGGRASEAEGLYMEKCSRCHGEFGEGVHPYGALEGGIGSLASGQAQRTVGSYWPYAPVLFDYIRRTMPFDRPQSLTNEEVYSLTAYLLAMNGIIEADQVMNKESLPLVQMPNRGGFVPDPRPDTKNRACMKDCLQGDE